MGLIDGRVRVTGQEHVGHWTGARGALDRTRGKGECDGFMLGLLEHMHYTHIWPYDHVIYPYMVI